MCPHDSSWTGGVPRQMSEANLARWGGGINFRKSTTPASVSPPSATRQSPPLLSRGDSFGYLFHNTFVSNSENIITFFLGSPYNTLGMTNEGLTFLFERRCGEIKTNPRLLNVIPLFYGAP